MAHHRPMKTPMDLFVHELSDMHSAERIVAQMLQQASGMVQNEQLRQALQAHEQETRRQIQNLEQVFQELGQQPHPITCHAADGLMKELKEGQKEAQSPQVLEGLVLGGAQKTEHYEIAGYTGLVKKAQAMGQSQIAQLLQQNLQQEQQTLQKLEGFGEQMIQQMASTMQSGQMGQMSQAEMQSGQAM